MRLVLNIPLRFEPDDEIPDGGDVLVDATIGGRPYRFRLDTGASRTELVADDFLAALPACAVHSSAGVFGQRENSDVITIPGLRAGDLNHGPLEVVRAVASPGRQHLLGMDLLGQFCCRFRFRDRVLELAPTLTWPASQELRSDRTSHPYAGLRWDGVTASACWDSGAGISVADQAFVAAHPDLFTPAGAATGSDSTNTQFSTPLVTMAGPVIAGVRFAPSTAAVVDLGPVNAGLDLPMAMIAGYPLLRQADWLFDFPAGRCAAPVLTGP
jgi:hypothetical protein